MSGPLVFAHRGASALLPEHTREAYQEAIAQGVDGLECDVRLTRDGHLVCIHDASVDRTSNGRGRVSAITLNELDQFDYRGWKNGGGTGIGNGSGNGGAATNGGGLHREDDTLGGVLNGGRTNGGTTNGHGILTLEQLIVTALAAGRPLRLLIETKHPSRFGKAVEEQVVALLERHGLSTVEGMAETGLAVTVMSFSPLAVRRMRDLAPEVPVVFLFDLMSPGVREGRAPFGATLLGPGLAAVKARPELVRRAQERGRQVYVWTVNERADIDLMLELGVDGIISDRPADVLERLGRSRLG